jgi:uncharacterized membrane protein YsdA (DUF1294 family)
MDAPGWSTLAALLAAALVADVVAWAAFRLDKRAARRGRRRIPERTLLALAAPGGLGALLGMYAAKQRHKTQKWHFVGLAWLFGAAQLFAAGYLTYRILR